MRTSLSNLGFVQNSQFKKAIVWVCIERAEDLVEDNKEKDVY